ncbi:T9SS type A sorting domain-containing protein [Subsaxibacter sp. CAU 1640]|uniref:T9SS type A sorting domain-containing protein n=1 Tax=Subsaxibacter sp. CAU 1640 TaxID=2933271 RepID=UPI0020032B38|nr:T9SS type A sorting domain-containing protein [Subsaxibacter sp. CAU 1640]MCK7590518.1 T9SS type A sorting domain-containing protein [Subsaxibacter sp. CAU 1640]
MKKTLLLSFIVALISHFNWAQPFAAAQNIDPDTGDEPYEIASGDLDGDGDIDLVMATYFYNSNSPTQDYIKWYSNDGNGNFTVETTVSSTIQWVDGLAVADIDGQFGLDIVATSVNQDKLVYFLSDGAGGFGPETSVDSAIAGPGEVVVSDINNDGNDDLITMSYTNNTTVWYAGDGAGNFSTANTIESGTTDGPYYVDVADFDGDGDLDVVVAFVNSQSIELYYNQYVESGTMTVSWIQDTVPVSTGNSFLFNIGFGDINNDGVMDIYKVDFTSGDVAWYNKTVNGPSVENIISDDNIITNPARAYVIDLDNDMLNDVILTDGGVQDDAIIFFKGASNAPPSATPTFIANNNNIMYDISVEDFDDDGDMDVASIGNTSDTVFWLENQLIVLGLSDSNFEELNIYPNPTNSILHFDGLTEAITISIYDNLGRNVMNTTLTMQQTLDVSHLNNGIYLMKFEGSNSTVKFIKK